MLKAIIPAPGVGANIEVDEASEGGPAAAVPVIEGPGEAGRGWANGSDISEVSIILAPVDSLALLDADEPPGVDIAPAAAREALLLVGVLGSGELSISIFFSNA
jgi:hypothetical protein